MTATEVDQRCPRMVIVRWIIALLVVVGVSRSAYASCGLRSWFSPTDRVAPLRGSVFSYTDGAFANEPPRIEWRDGHGTTTLVQVSPTITRIDYQGTHGATLRIRPAFLEDQANPLYSAELVLSMYADSAATPRMKSIGRVQGAWTCSSYDTLVIELDAPAAAMRTR